MQKRILPIAIVAITLISFIGWNCTKLDTTTIGADLLPAVDNVNTFDTILTINSAQGFFNDSTYIGKYDDYTVGSISNDPLFGQTTANVYMQLKPPFYPYYFGSPGDTITGPGLGIDSVVLCLKFRGFWGDSLIPVHLEVREVNDRRFGIDSVLVENRTAYKPTVAGAILGSANIDVRTLGNVIKFNNGRDSVTNQIRIKLSSAWAAQLFGRDSTAANFGNNAYNNDSIYRSLYSGIAVIAGGGGNGLIYTSLSDTATKLEIHYKRKNFGKVDSIYSSFRLNPSFSPLVANAPVSNTSNYIKRDRTGYPINNPTAAVHYLQTSPGTFVNVNIPGLPGFPNGIIHRAEIILEQLTPLDPLDDKLLGPNFLYLDLRDSTAAAKWKPIYLDLNPGMLYYPDNNGIPYIANPIDYQYFGGFRRSKLDNFGNTIRYYNFNVTRYVQQIVTKRTNSYDMRIYAPFNINYPQYSGTFIPYSNNIAMGRIRIGGGAHPTHNLRLRIVYSKIK